MSYFWRCDVIWAVFGSKDLWLVSTVVRLQMTSMDFKKTMSLAVGFAWSVQKNISNLAFRCTNIGFSCGFLSSLEPGPPVLKSRGRPPELALRLEKQTPYVAQTGTGRRLESVPYAPWLYMGVMNLCESFFDRMKRQLYRKLDRH